MNWKIIFNPFEKYEEKILLVIGIFSIIIVLLLGHTTDSYLSSIYRIVSLQNIGIFKGISITMISYLVAIIVLFILGKLMYKNTRIIDIINTVLISQIPLFFIIPMEKIGDIQKAGNNIMNYQNHPTGAFPIMDFVIMILITFFPIGTLAYSIALFYNGFKTATNMKKWQHIVLFSFVTFITIIICQIFNT